MHVIFTGTKSSETCCHFTVPAPLALTWNTSAHSLEILIAELYVVITRLIRVSKYDIEEVDYSKGKYGSNRNER